MAVDPKNAIKTIRVDFPAGGYSVTYLFKCSECDEVIRVQSGQLKRATGKCRSCCQKKRPFESAYTQLLGNKKRGISTSLSYEDFADMCLVKNCHYCDSEIKRTTKRGEKGYRGYFLDRKNNSIGYEKNNVVPCCWECNQAKGNRYSYDQFVAMIRAKKELDKKSRYKPSFRDLFIEANSQIGDWQ